MKATKMYFAVDPGSTQTVLMNFDEVMEIQDELVSDAVFSVVEGKREPKRISDKLEDNLYMLIKDETFSKPNKIITDQISVYKGSLMIQEGHPRMLTKGNKGKAEQDTTYINTLFTIALYCYKQWLSAGKEGFQFIEADVTAALRPTETKNDNAVKSFKNKLAGMYEIKLPLLGYSMQLNITNILAESEPDAVVRAYVCEVDDAFENVAVGDGGGSSFDVAITEDGVLKVSGSDSGLFGGGSFLESLLEKEIAEAYNFIPSKKAVHQAVITGVLKDGSKNLEIKDCMKNVMEVLATKMLAQLMNVLDVEELSLRNMQAILTCGRLMTTDFCGNGTLTEMLGKEVAKSSPNTSIIKLDGYPIVRGLAYFRLCQEDMQDAC